MPIDFESKVLRDTIETLTRIVPSNAPAANICQDVRIATNEEAITFTTSDMNISMRAQLDTGSKPSLFLVNALKFRAAVLGLAGDTISLNLDKKLFVSSDSTKIGINLSTNDLQTFPDMPDIDGPIFTLPSEPFCMALKSALACASDNDTRPILTGIHLSFTPDALYLESADGFAALRAKLDLAYSDTLDVVIPSRFAREIIRANKTDSLDLRISDTMIGARLGNLCLTSTTIAGRFPNVAMAIPKKWATTVIVNRKTLLQAIKSMRVGGDLYSAEHKRVVCALQCEFEANELKLQAHTDTSEANATVPTQHNGPPQTLWLDAEYWDNLLDAINSDTVEIGLNGPTSGVGLFNDSHTLVSILMPRAPEQPNA